MLVFPLIDNSDRLRYLLSDFLEFRLDKTYPDLAVSLKGLNCQDRLCEFEFACHFLIDISNRSQTSFLRYRNIIEKLLLWSWNVRDCSIKGLNLKDIDKFIDFTLSPLDDWIERKQCQRFIQKENVIFSNPHWRPFSCNNSQSPQTLASTYTVLNAFFEYLVKHRYLTKNPVPEIRKKDCKVKNLVPVKANSVVNSIDEILNKMVTFSFDNLNALRGLTLFLLIKESHVPMKLLCGTEIEYVKVSQIIERNNQYYLTLTDNLKELNFQLKQYTLLVLRRYLALCGKPLVFSENHFPLFHRTRGRGGYEVRQLRRLYKSFLNDFVDAHCEFTVNTLEQANYD